MTAAEAAAYAGDPGRQLEIGRLAATVPAADDGDDRIRFLRAALTGVSDMLSGDTTTGITALTAAEAIADGFDDPTYLRWAASAAVYAGSADVERRYLRLIERTRELGAVGAMPYALEFVAVVHATNGQFTDAVSEATEGLRLARDTGQDAAVGTLLAALAIVAALQGRDQECRAYADEALGLAIPRQLGITVGFAGWALALLDLGMGHPNEALERLLAVASAGPGAGHPAVSVASLGPLVDAAVWAGRPTVGRDMLNRLGPWVERTGPHYGAMLSYCRARLADGPDAAALFEETLARLHDMPQPFPLARAHLSYGQHLRRLRQRGASRVHLRAAVEGFDLIGAAPWAARARTELRATGETARQRDVSTTGQLTPQEKQIVQRVANGLSNREIGAQLFLSARTVEYHLRKVFHKLGLTSRTELFRLDLSGQLGTE